MNCTVENLEKSMAKLKITVPAEEFKKALTEAYNKQKGRFQLQGFRKGKAPQKLIEKVYGEGVFYESAVNALIDRTYPQAAKESGLEIVSRPEIDVTEIGAGKDLVYTAEVAVRPDVVLGEYKGIEVKKADAGVSEEDIEAELKKEQKKNARTIDVEGRAAEQGDIANIDFEGSVDGVPFDGGKGEKYPLTLGSGSFIPGFEEQVVGHNVGDEFDVKVTFPEDYHAADLKGKEAVFRVKLNELKKEELPELDDEFASEVSEFDTLDAFKEDIKKRLSDTKQKSAAAQNEDAVIKKVIENAAIEIPAPMLETQIDNLVNDYARRMQAQGLDFRKYLEYTGQTMDQVRDQFRDQADERIRTRLVLEEIVKAENIEIAEEAVENEIRRIAEQYKQDFEKLNETIGEEERKSMELDLKIQEAVDFLVAEAKLV